MDKVDIQRALVGLITLTGFASALWSASMLVGGFDVSGQLSSDFNPMGKVVLYVAAISIVASTGLWYYCLTNAERNNVGAAVATGTLVLMLTAFASITQLFSVVDASSGSSFEKGAEASVTSVWSATRNIDQNIAEVYNNRVAFSNDRMAEEAETGRGPRFREAAANFNRLRQTYGSVLETPLSRVPQGRSLSDDISGARDYITALRAKVQVFENFGREVQIVTPDYAAQLDGLEARLNRLNGGDEGSWVDRRSLVYSEVVRKLGEMLASGGSADLGFSLSALLAVMPDIIQLLCALLLVMLRSNEQDTY